MKTPLLILLFGVWLSLIGRAGASSAIVSAAEYGEKWPFTVSEGVIECTPFRDNLHIVTFTAQGKTYGLNGTARNFAKEKGYAEIDTIWKADPKNRGAKIDISPITSKALSLCE